MMHLGQMNPAPYMMLLASDGRTSWGMRCSAKIMVKLLQNATMNTWKKFMITNSWKSLLERICQVMDITDDSESGGFWGLWESFRGFTIKSTLAVEARVQHANAGQYGHNHAEALEGSKVVHVLRDETAEQHTGGAQKRRHLAVFNQPQSAWWFPEISARGRTGLAARMWACHQKRKESPWGGCRSASRPARTSSTGTTPARKTDSTAGLRIRWRASAASSTPYASCLANIQTRGHSVHSRS